MIWPRPSVDFAIILTGVWAPIVIVCYEVINGITWAVVLNERGEVLYRKRVRKCLQVA
jgi:hypothetical protein